MILLHATAMAWEGKGRGGGGGGANKYIGWGRKWEGHAPLVTTRGHL